VHPLSAVFVGLRRKDINAGQGLETHLTKVLGHGICSLLGARKLDELVADLERNAGGREQSYEAHEDGWLLTGDGVEFRSCGHGFTLRTILPM